jgi:hypothetical protein
MSNGLHNTGFGSAPEVILQSRVRWQLFSPILKYLLCVGKAIASWILAALERYVPISMMSKISEPVPGFLAFHGD